MASNSIIAIKKHHAVSGRNIRAYLGNDVEFGVNTSLLLLLQTKVHCVYRIIMCYLASIPANKVGIFNFKIITTKVSFCATAYTQTTPTHNYFIHHTEL